ncbi:DHH family phosphoesterase [Portibacter lacus]|uniref:Exopolyphosphatase n=1 Tax=Portibacter lacus TaxID=1099794 RepID=A0AA37SMX9_9BACT|nr:bifunctional oligoribonuclease/PAP phosphatase NrnA [Portibacter lacus]GLR15921.1 exopolyphosphatase [Portibacter lacus]
MMENIDDLKSFLAMPREIVIVSHRNPDGDAIGSSLGLGLYLQRKRHNVKIIFPSEFPDVFNYLPESDYILIHDNEPDTCDVFLDKAEVIFCLDFNSLDRIDRLGVKINGKQAVKVMIDHHIDPEPFPDYMLSEVSASSTSELIYDFITMLGDEKMIDPIMGECLYTGIITDTGSFRFSTSAKLFRIVAKLKEIGVDDKKLQDYIFNSMPIKNMQLLGHCLNNRMEIIEEYGVGIIVLNKYDYKNFDIQRGDTEGIVNYLLMMKKIRLGVFISQQPNIIKLSMRSKGDLSVQQIARDHFKGGGHKNASGGSFHGSLKSAIEKFKEILPDYLNKIN